MLTTSSTALIVGEAQPARAELLAEHAILGLEIVDQVTLVLVDPARQRNNEEPERKRERSHELSVSEGRSGLIQVAKQPRGTHHGPPGWGAAARRSNCWTVRDTAMFPFWCAVLSVSVVAVREHARAALRREPPVTRRYARPAA
jgi:hypothetical protein